MRFVFITSTFILLFILFGNIDDRALAPETLNDKIKTTSLSRANPILNREPVVFLPPQSSTASIKTAQQPALEVAAALVVDLNTNRRLLSYGLEKRWPIASLTKLMTATLAAESVGFQKEVTLSLDDILAEGSAGDFKEGEVFTVGDLVEAMLVSSSNDAAEAVARFYGYRKFIDLMQEKAAKLGLENTAFADPTGLTSLNQSSLDDLEKLVRYIIRHHPEFFKLSQQKETALTEIRSAENRVIKNINKFSGRDDFLGGKTGYIDEAGGNLISLFNDNGRRLLIIVLGATDRFVETERLYEWAKTMLQ